VEYAGVREWPASGRAHEHYLLRTEAAIPDGLIGRLLSDIRPGATHSCREVRNPVLALDYLVKARHFGTKGRVPPPGRGKLIRLSRRYLARPARKLWAERLAEWRQGRDRRRADCVTDDELGTGITKGN
jgi:hypothetical protein